MIKYADIIQCSAVDAQGLADRWQEHGISGIINVAWNIVPDMRYDPLLPVLRHPALDEAAPDRDWFEPIFAFYDWARKHGKVVVHCQAGQNRSLGLTGILMVARHGLTGQQALKITGRPAYGAWIHAVEDFKL
jgi:hypothetical protein